MNGIKMEFVNSNAYFANGVGSVDRVKYDRARKMIYFFNLRRKKHHTTEILRNILKKETFKIKKFKTTTQLVSHSKVHLNGYQ